MEHFNHLNWSAENDRILRTCKNEQVRMILEENVALQAYLKSGNFDEFFTRCFKAMRNLHSLTFADETLYGEVLNITFEVATFSLKKENFNYLNFIKLILRMLKANIVITTQHGETSSMALNFVYNSLRWMTKNNLSANSSLPPNLALIQLKIISELLLMFPRTICDAQVLVESLLENQVNYGASSDLNMQLEDIILNRLSIHGSFKQFFNINLNENQVEAFYKLCLKIADKIIRENLLANALPIDNDSNFCLQLITSVSAHPQIIDMSIFEQIVKKIMKILYHPMLENLNFRFIEKSIIKGIFSDDLWTSVTCFHVICEFLQLVNSRTIVETYFIFFQNILSRKSYSCPENSLSQLFVLNIVLLITKVHSTRLDPEKIETKLKMFTNCESHSKLLHDGFELFFRAMVLNPTASNYYKLNKVLKLLSGLQLHFSVIESEKFSQLLEMVKKCDWMLHFHLIANVMGVMIATSDPIMKMAFMVKISSALNKEKPLNLKLRLVELMIAYIPLLRNNKTGLPGILRINLLPLTLNDEKNIIAKITVIRKFLELGPDIGASMMKEILYFDHNEASVDLMQKLITRRMVTAKHFKVTYNYTQTKQLNTKLHVTLQMILKYSEGLQNRPLQDIERQVVQKIIRNFETAIKK